MTVDPNQLIERRRKNNLCAVLNIDAATLSHERELNETKWFDYRFMTPFEATLLFRGEYQAAYRYAWGTMMSTAEADKKRGLSLEDLLPGTRGFTSLWRARQKADALGLPYRMFIDHAIGFLTSHSWDRIPRPNQLLSGKQEARVAAAACQYLIDEMEGIWRASELPHYLVEAFIGFPAQAQHQEWVLDIVRHRGNKGRAICRACFQDRTLPIDRATAEFPLRSIEEAGEHGEKATPAAAVALDREELRPACFGLPGAFSADAAECDRCPVKPECPLEGERVLETVRNGSLETVADRRRALGAQRTRRCRARKAAAASSAPGAVPTSSTSAAA